ncbi:histidine phosphatase family protein [Sphingopyxis sp. MWB1]|uniref:histidine phosphatase family protein n=1 Tax=Sphingopyxis sp. MWB1 TaxID=1537715 RepID=UPI00051A3A2B|nr:histidine phosphatase family protein [Sphingopyxis sp. MWB1]
MKPFALHLLRHGAPEVPGLMLGHSDMAPTSDGIAACAAQVGDLHFERILSSDLARCRRAAEHIGAAHHVEAIIDPRWREMNFGAWDGQSATALDPALLERFWADPDDSPPPEGESWSALVGRVSAALAELAEQAPVPTLVVTHAGAIRAALHQLCGFPLKSLWSFSLPYGALISLTIWPDGDRTDTQIERLQP